MPRLFKYLNSAIKSVLIISFMSMNVSQTQAGETVVSLMPKPGTIVHLSSAFIPAHLEGITIHQDNVLRLDFLIHKGDGHLDDLQKKEEYRKLIKYFLASLTVPDRDQWVNLSPYEKDRIIESNFGNTEMGQDLLSQDYLLKQITSSLMYPEAGLGKKFWDRVYERAWNEYHTTNIPVNTFNKVWIVPDEAVVYESKTTAYILKSHLKVMLEEDYLSLNKHTQVSSHTLASKIIKEVLLPELEKEVNEGKNFALLRQIYSGMILATWYKKALRESLLGQVYVDKARVKGIDRDPRINGAIYQQYLAAFKKGVFNFIKEEVVPISGMPIKEQGIFPRKYFAGGFDKVMGAKPKYIDAESPGVGMLMQSRLRQVVEGQIDEVSVGLDSAMNSTAQEEQPLPEFVDQETRQAVNTREIPSEFVVPIGIIRAITKLSDQYAQQLDHLSNTERQKFVLYLEQELKSFYGPRVVAAAIAIAKTINLKDSTVANKDIRLEALRMIKAHAKLLEPNRELKGLMDVRSTSYSDGTDTPAALVLEAWKRGLGTLVIADYYSVDGIGEAIEASRILEGPKIAPAVTIDYSAEIPFRKTERKVITRYIEFGHIAISFPLDNPNIEEWIKYKQKELDENPTWKRLKKRQVWHRMKMDLIISRWNQIHSTDGLALTLEQQKQIPPYPRSQTLISLLSRLHPGVKPVQLRRDMADQRVYEVGTPGAQSLTDVHWIAQYYGGETSFSMPLEDILNFTDNIGGAAFIRDPADPRTFMKLQDGIEKARGDAQADEQPKTIKYQMSPKELSDLMNMLKGLLTKYRIQGLQVYTPKHTPEEVDAFEKLREGLVKENIQDGYYDDHGLAFVAGSNGSTLQEQELVYGRGMGIPENWSRESRWQSLQNQWVSARRTRLRLLKEIGRAHSLGLTYVSIKNRLELQVWKGLVRWNKTKSLREVLTPVLVREIRREARTEKLNLRIDDSPEDISAGPTIGEIAHRNLSMEQTINDARILKAIELFVGKWDRPDKRILAFDVDGTVAESDKEIPNEVLEYYMAFMKEGVDIVLITGRGPNDYLVDNLAKRIPRKLRHKLHIFARTSALGYGFDMNGNLINYYRYRLTPKIKIPIFEAIKKIIPEARLVNDSRGDPTGATIREFPEDSQISIRLNTIEKQGFTSYTKDQVSDLVSQLGKELFYLEGAVHVVGPMGEGHAFYDIDIVLTLKPRGIEYAVRTIHGRNDEIGDALLYFGDSMTRLGNDRKVPEMYPKSVSFWVGRGPFSEKDLEGTSNIIPVIPAGTEGTVSVLHGIAQRIEYIRGTDRAMNARGGIDFNSKNFDLRIEHDGKNMLIPLTPKDMAQLSQITGFIPVILAIKSPTLSEVQRALR